MGRRGLSEAARETAHKRTHGDDTAKLAWLKQCLCGRLLAEITREEITAISKRKKAEAINSTANRYLSLVRAVLLKAWLEWHWLDRVPRVKPYREAKRRVRWFTPEQVRALLDELPEPNSGRRPLMQTCCIGAMPVVREVPTCASSKAGQG